MQKDRKGFFIAIDGIDGAGSSTQAALLAERLKQLGYDVVHTKEPNPDGMIVPIIRALLREQCILPELDALLFAADRVHHVEAFIIPWLKEGKIVITDRYLESSIAYQSSQGLDDEWIITINRRVINPDLTIILDIDPEISLKRKGLTYDRFERAEFLRKVRSKFLDRASKMGYKVIDASKPILEVHQEILNTALTKLRNEVTN